MHTKRAETIEVTALLWKNSECDEAFKSLDMAKDFARLYDKHYNLTEKDSITKELPDVWPWWAIEGYADIEREIKSDPRWNKWVKRCKN